MSDTVISFRNVSKYYPLYHHVTGSFKSFLFHLPTAIESMRKTRYEALRDVSFDINTGETVGIIGRNGAGKSTLLALMAKVIKPSSGEVEIRRKVAPLLDLGTGFHQELTGRENIMLNAVLLGLTRAEVVNKIDGIIEFSELNEFIDQPIRTYSKGMLARLGFSIVSSLEADILLIDEILAVGDMDFKRKCLDRILNIRDIGVTIVLVSHALDEIRRICDRAIWIGKYVSEEHPSVRMIGKTEDVIHKYMDSF